MQQQIRQKGGQEWRHKHVHEEGSEATENCPSKSLSDLRVRKEEEKQLRSKYCR